MVVEARVRLRQEDDFAATLRGGEQVMHLSGDWRTCLCVFQTDRPERVEEFLGRHGRFFKPGDVLSRGAASAVVSCRCPTNGIGSSLVALGGVVRWPIVHRGGWKWYDVVAESRDVVRRIVEHLATLGHVELLEVREAEPERLSLVLRPTDFTGALTSRQRRALRIAVERGYYETPRRSNLEALATEMGVARSTFQEHLQKAEQSVVHLVTGVWERYPSLLEDT